MQRIIDDFHSISDCSTASLLLLQLDCHLTRTSNIATNDPTNLRTLAAANKPTNGKTVESTNMPTNHNPNNASIYPTNKTTIK